jgi:hypothetical protein
MQQSAVPKADPAAAVVPPIVAAAAWRVGSVHATSSARLRVEFVDGTAGEVDMAAFLANPSVEGTIFEALRDPAFFEQARVILGTVQWPNGADLAPDAMYDAIREHRSWVVE